MRFIRGSGLAAMVLVLVPLATGCRKETSTPAVSQEEVDPPGFSKKQLLQAIGGCVLDNAQDASKVLLGAKLQTLSIPPLLREAEAD